MKRSEWRAKRDKKLTLPSGNEIVARKVGIKGLATRKGAIPAPLLGAVETLMKTEGKNLNIAMLPEIGELMDLIVMACVIDPKVVDDIHSDAQSTSEDEILLSDFDHEDKQFIYNWANAEAEKLAPFRQESVESLAVAPDGVGVRSDAGLAHGNNGRMGSLSVEPRDADSGK